MKLIDIWCSLFTEEFSNVEKLQNYPSRDWGIEIIIRRSICAERLNWFTPTTSTALHAAEHGMSRVVAPSDVQIIDSVTSRCHWAAREIFKFAISIRCQVHEPQEKWSEGNWRDRVCCPPRRWLHVSRTMFATRRDNEMFCGVNHRKASLRGVFDWIFLATCSTGSINYYFPPSWEFP